jgi:hypothetical protein
MLSTVVVLSRLAHSVVHVLSGARWAILLRFACFVTQVCCMLGMIAELVRLLPSARL